VRSGGILLNLTKMKINKNYLLSHIIAV
jgi:hypothetical protein